MAFNTIINDRSSGGIFLRVAKGASHVLLLNNVWIGKGSLNVDAPLDSRGNVEAPRKDFSNPDRLDYRPRKAFRLVGQAGFRGADASNLMLPLRGVHASGSSCPLVDLVPLTPLTPGAFQTIAP